MRDIKFRAWDTKHKKWVDHTEACDFMIFGQLPKTAPIELRFPDWWKVNWYTGLKDKNGKEIYEGDIVKAGKKYVGVVEHYAGSWSGLHIEKKITTSVGYAANLNDELIEVIGNRFEYPELLQ